ncbi:Alpha-2-macroglobulin domain protein [Neorhizobium galegae bv. officinalis bv. officinalis str. HAMBI 1141]|uniref:Alpha-2-macroglobulin domain protein n=1 Tax=Neorhizobium galegae bv. officinalis bv. officinalis str. HAMBI 1141 TaxID=1028801 RepID=A0A068TC39_NEOGA|nr:alpha-2-macroglobulin family protein [Neorhizobium galegae]CDN56092.1 Alpha-2-macroglobulin domain protein [Neorhizobium galegae bv. officinalis bv. officinalis str. HAMBI 1141]
MSRRALFGFLALIVSAFALVSPLTAADRRIESTPNSDYLGFDLRTVKNVSQPQCEAACIGDNACKAFTYNEKAKWCFLKSDYSQLNPFPGATAGKIVVTAVEPDIGAPPKLSFLSEEVLQQARDQKDGLTLGDNQQGYGVENLKTIAQGQVLAGNIDTAVYNFKGALSVIPDDGALWIELARAASTAKNNTTVDGEGTLAAVNGYQLSRTTQTRADALAVLGAALAKQQNYRAALNAYKASLALVNARTVQAAYNDLRERQGFRMTGNTVDADSANPRVCVQFSEPLVKIGVDYAPFVVLNGQAPKAMEAKDSQICVEGLTHGQRYKLSLRRGLPSSVDEPLAAQVDIDVYVKDRSATVRFTGDSFVLPSTARRGIPIVSVNTEKANLKLYRVGDRSIAPLLANSQFLTQMDGYNATQIQEQSGELVWQGTIDITQDLNKDVVTSFPVDEALPTRKPGVYMLTAAAANAPSQEYDTKATQWFVVSDIGLTTYAGTDGLNVFARSLGSAKPMAGVDLQLLAKNNEILGTAKTDADGRAVFTAGLMRGTAAMVPAVLAAQNNGQDYVFLDMARAGFDLSDRGVTGRPAPGAIDILPWTERGIYRPGETVHASALARNIDATAIENLPLTFVFLRPDGVEDRRIVNNGSLGGYALDLPLLATSMRGTWTMQIFTDPKGSAIGEKTFLVDDFVPDRIEFDMTSDAKEIAVGEPAPVNIDGRYLYGAPAAGLNLEGEIALKTTRENPAFPGYQFGLVDEEASEAVRIPLEALEPLDDDGKVTFDATVAEAPSTTQLVNADIVVRMQEAGGRAIERSITLPVKAEGARIGIKPEFSGDLGENSVGNFTVIMVDAAGKKQAVQNLPWKLVKIDRDYQWYRDGSSWRYEPVTRTSQAANGTVNVTADGGKVSVPVKWGRYRLEVETADIGGPTSSVEFDAGWFVTATSTETPDALEIALDKQSYKVGETAKLKVSSRYAGELMITSGSESLIAVKTASIGANGGEVDIPVTAAWGAGSYVTATLYRPGQAQESRMPMRAIGVTWLKVDPENRDLQVSITAPEKTLPRQPLNISLQVAGAGANQDAYVTVAAVDVGILNLTRYQPPAPDDWYFGQRRLGLEIRDLYGRLIDGSLGATGRLRTGGDGGNAALQSSPPKEKLIAFFSGPVKLDAQGKANVSFDIPQFNGTARVMAVAWSKTGVGHGVKDVVIRDPVVVTASLPRFLAPGDQTNLRLDIANTDAPAGDYQLAITTNKPVSVDQKGTGKITLAAGGKSDVTLALRGVEPGDGSISIRLSNASGMSLDQVLDIPVRPAAMPITQQRLVELKPGSSVTVDANLLADSILPGASISVNVSRSTAFDIPALLMSLSRYPYGCAEQTTSRALPLLYLSQMAVQNGLADDTEVKKRVQDAIYRVLSYQSSAGSFGLWGPGGGDLWLDSYVSDFLSRAREQGYDVPEQALVQALDSLQNSLGFTNNVKDQGNEIAYALYVLARNRKAAISDLRYYADTMLNDFPTPLAKAHIAAALALYGDAQRSKNIFAASLQMSQDAQIHRVSLSRSDYGSSLRDGAAVLALAAESRPVPPIVPALATIVAKEWGQKKYTSTQEQTWMLLAARALQNGDDGLRLQVNGADHRGTLMSQMTGDALIGHPLTVKNNSADPLSASITTVAAPAQPLPAGGDGFKITRTYYSMDGEEANVSEAQQNQRYVAVIKITESNNWPSRIVVTDLLPAGFEIDNPSIVNSASLANFDWIEEVQAAHTEFRNDRFVAAFDRSAGDNREITLAYVVRAVTPGVYDHPAAQVEDMYRPQFSARTAMGKMEVLAAQ